MVGNRLGRVLTAQHHQLLALGRAHRHLQVPHQRNGIDLASQLAAQLAILSTLRRRQLHVEPYLKSARIEPAPVAVIDVRELYDAQLRERSPVRPRRRPLPDQWRAPPLAAWKALQAERTARRGARALRGKAGSQPVEQPRFDERVLVQRTGL